MNLMPARRPTTGRLPPRRIHRPTDLNESPPFVRPRTNPPPTRYPPARRPLRQAQTRAPVPRSPMGRPLRLWTLLAALLAVPAAGQDRGFRLEGLVPGGGRTSVTEAWGTLRFTATNFDPEPHDLRVLVFYPEHPDVQFGRDVWV